MHFLRCIIDSSKASERKLFLTPLVTFLEDPRNGIDIDFSVDKVLSPLRRKTFISPEPVFKDGAENGSPSEIIEEPMNSCTIQFGHEGRSMEYTEPVENSSRGMAFHLCLTDEQGTCCRPVVKDTVIQPARMLKVILDWTEKEYELYDASYLKDLPEVHKSGLTVKKTKQEAISLFSCLEAFLKEEPLGPDDMWYVMTCVVLRSLLLL